MTAHAHAALEQLTDLLGNRLLTDPESAQRYGVDWTKVWAPAPSAVALPETIDEVQQIVEIANDHGLHLVPSGGRTGLSAGAVAANGELVVAFDRMNKILEFNEFDRAVTVQPGVITQQLQEFAEQKGLFYPVDFASAGSSQIGGNIGTNAGGIKVIRYGMTRSLVLGLEAVLADGTVISAMNKMVKNNSGYDLKHLFIGSEGTLGIVTKVVVQLQPKLLASHTALCALEDYDSVIKLLAELKRSLGSGLTGFELMWDNYFNKVLAVESDLQDPFSEFHPFYLLVEYKDNETALGAERFESELFGHLESGLLTDAVVAQSHQDAAEFWRIRDGIGELFKVLGPVSNQDVSLPIRDIGIFATHLETRLKAKYSDIAVLLFGHIGDNNLHVCAYTGREEDKITINEDIMLMIGEYSGAITAEHGVGVLKRDFLDQSRTAKEIALMKTIKLAMDPKGILNPGRVINPD